MLRLAALVVAVLVGTAGCGGDGSTTANGGTSTTVDGGSTTVAPVGGTGVPATGGGSGTSGTTGGSRSGRSTGGTGTTAKGSTGTGGGTTGTGGATGTTAAGPGGPTTSPPSTTQAQQQDLDAQLGEAVKITPFTGFAEQPPPGNGLGALDMESASGGDPSERDALNTAGFRRGYARGWTNKAEELTTIVYQLGSDAQANAYLQDTIESSIKGNGSATFDVGVNGATGYREQGTDPSGQQYIAWGAVFVRGSRFYEQILRGPREGNTRSEADARDLCRRQAERVGG
jgi:hypothetical protein